MDIEHLKQIAVYTPAPRIGTLDLVTKLRAEPSGIRRAQMIEQYVASLIEPQCAALDRLVLLLSRAVVLTSEERGYTPQEVLEWIGDQTGRRWETNADEDKREAKAKAAIEELFE